MRQALAPMRLGGFRHLAFAYSVNELGNWLGEIALAVLVFDETGSPLATAALFVGMQFLPAVFGQALVATLALAGRAFTRAATAAVLAPAGQLRQGNALLNLGFTAAGALGPLLA